MCLYSLLWFFNGVPIGITSSAIGLEICVIIAGIKKYKWITKKKEKKRKHDKILLLAKSKLNSVEILISKTLVDLNIIHDEFVLMKNVLKECNDMKEEIKSLITYSSLRNILVYL